MRLCIYSCTRAAGEGKAAGEWRAGQLSGSGSGSGGHEEEEG